MPEGNHTTFRAAGTTLHPRIDPKMGMAKRLEFPKAINVIVYAKVDGSSDSQKSISLDVCDEVSLHQFFAPTRL